MLFAHSSLASVTLLLFKLLNAPKWRICSYYNYYVSLQVTYSQCLGVIGYCLLPLIIVGLALPLIKFSSILASFAKVINLLDVLR